MQNPDPRDPWEGFNRGVYSVNDSIDRVVVKPVAQAYTYVTPQPVRSCISNIFGNLGDVWSAANSFLQGRGLDGINTVGRVLFNTTMGVGGCFDVASETGAYKIPNDFGVTLGVWGIGQGPYLVLPLFGPSTVRDGVGRIADTASPVALGQLVENTRWRNSLWGLQLVNTRANLLDTTDMIDRVSIDPYSFVRDAYLQRREGQVRGNNADAPQNLPDYSDPDDADAANGPAMPPVAPASAPTMNAPGNAQGNTQPAAR